MTIELINTGTELMLGRVLNTHQQWLCRQLAGLGYEVARQVTVSDDGPAIQQAVREALARADLVITTGGLGPTSDDRTRDVAAELLGRRLETNAVVLEEIRQFFTRRNRPQPRSTEVQALVPEGATILHNAHGTAPGLVLEAPPGRFRTKGTWLFLLPGPPRELRPMFTQQVVPLVQKLFPLAAPFVCRTLRTTGLGESQVEERIRGPLEALVRGGLEVGYCAATGAVDVRLAARGPQAAPQLAAGERILRELLGQAIYGEEDALLEQQVIRLLTERGQTLAVAESCTGGLLGHRLTNVPGASAVFLGGCLTYSDEAKQTLLGVRADTLRTHGAVSEPTAREMAEGVRSRLGADFALAVTGIAGPAGGTPAKPVGTVFIGLAAADETVVRSYFNPYDRETFKLVTSQQALELLRQRVGSVGSVERGERGA
jgi:nicotinamide-nucleotide amidase